MKPVSSGGFSVFQLSPSFGNAAEIGLGASVISTKNNKVVQPVAGGALERFGFARASFQL